MIPADVLRLILTEYLDAMSTLRCRLVCRRFAGWLPLSYYADRFSLPETYLHNQYTTVTGKCLPGGIRHGVYTWSRRETHGNEISVEHRYEYGRLTHEWLHVNCIGVSDYYTRYNHDGSTFAMRFEYGRLYTISHDKTMCIYSGGRPYMMFNDRVEIIKRGDKIRRLTDIKGYLGRTPHGRQEVYRRDGSLRRVLHYDNGRLLHREDYRHDGSLRQKIKICGPRRKKDP